MSLNAPALKVCIVGLGAVGGVIAAGLARLPPRRVALSALARGATLAALRHDGLVLQDAGGEHRLPLAAGADPAALGPQDLVIVAVKGPALAAVAPAVQALCGPQTQVLVAMNGVPWWFFDALPGAAAGLRLASVDPGDAVRRHIASERVIGAVVHFSASTPAPGRVRHGSGRGLILGRALGAPDAALAQAAALLAEAGFETSQSALIQRDIWFKLWGNLTMNPVSALTGATADRVLDDPLVRGFIVAVMLEAQAIGSAIGLPIDQTPEQRHVVTRQLGAFKTSMLQDLEAGRPLEIDNLVGAVHEIGRHLALPTPQLDALFGLVRLLAQQRGLAAA
jgi:2-dehydropantoate 2-reductase